MRSNHATGGRARFPAHCKPMAWICPNWWKGHLTPQRSVQEVAAIIGISVNAVRTHESTALRKLREQIRKRNWRMR